MLQSFTYGADEAGVVPGVTEGLQELVSSLDGELTATAAGPKQTVEVCSQTKQHAIQYTSGYKTTILPLLLAAK